MAKRYTRHRRQKRNRNRNRTMKGGAFTQQELQQLQNSGFSEYQIESLTNLGVSFNEVIQKVNTIMNQPPSGFHGNSDAMTEQVMVELLNEHIFENPNTQQLDMDQSFESQGTMNSDELNTSNMSGYTSNPDDSDNEVGGRRRRRITKKRHVKKSRKTRKQRGGMCFGNGVGANSYDPNYSIYNTNMLKLFPYRTTN